MSFGGSPPGAATVTLIRYQDDVGTEPEPETGTVGTVFPGTEARTGTVNF